MPVDYDPQFQSVNLGLHRRTASRLGTPSLVWHRYHWKPADLDVLEWHKRIAELLYRAFLGLQHLKLSTKGSKLSCPNYDGHRLFTFKRFWSPGSVETLEKIDELRRAICLSRPIDSDHNSLQQNVFACDLDIYGLKFSFRSTLQTEYWTIRIIVDGSRDTRRMPKVFANIRKIFGKINKMTDQAVKCYNSKWYKNPSHRQTHLAKLAYLSRDSDKVIVKSFQDFCNSTIENLLDLSLGSDAYKSLVEKTIFGEFVGLVLGMTLEGSESPTDFFGHRPKLGLKRTNFTDSRMSMLERNPTSASFDASDATHLLDSMWPMIKNIQRAVVKEPTDSIDNVARLEFTASLFQRGRFLYASSLGRNPSSVQGSSPYPVVYVGVCGHSNRWQLGRIIDKIHDLGSLRLAAVRDFQSILDGGRQISSARAKMGGEEFDLGEVRKVLDTAEIGPQGGLQYRLERGKYYIERFRIICKSLDITRIEGFQPYDSFVERRLSDKFNTIEYVARIYEKTIYSFQSYLYLDLQRNIKDQAGAARRLLHTAERISLLPLSYYVGSMIQKIGEHPPVAIMEIAKNAFFSYTIGGLISYLFLKQIAKTAQRVH